MCVNEIEVELMEIEAQLDDPTLAKSAARRSTAPHRRCAG